MICILAILNCLEDILKKLNGFVIPFQSVEQERVWGKSIPVIPYFYEKIVINSKRV